MSECPFCSEPIPEERRPEKAELYACGSCMNPVILDWVDTAVQARAMARATDIRRLSPEGSIGRAILDGLPAALEDLPVLPEISQRVMTMVADPDVSMPDLAEVIRGDQVIALKVMQLANSAVYGGLHEISDLSAACSRLGMKSIAEAVQSVAAGNLFITGDKGLLKHMQRLWRHSLAAAHCADRIAGLLAVPRPESLFLAGLIHDIGKVVLLDIVSSKYSGVVTEVRKSEKLFGEVVEAFHPLVGLHVTQYWSLPPEFAVTTYCHHDPEQVPDEVWLQQVHIVGLANAIAKAEGFGVEEETEETFLTGLPSVRYLNLSDIKLAGIRIDLADTLEEILGVMAQGD